MARRDDDGLPTIESHGPSSTGKCERQPDQADKEWERLWRSKIPAPFSALLVVRRHGQRWRGRSRQGVVWAAQTRVAAGGTAWPFRLLAGSCRSASHYGGPHWESILLVAATFGTIVRWVRTCAGALNGALAGLGPGEVRTLCRVASLRGPFTIGGSDRRSDVRQ
jgi:hypothetical protein